MRCLVEQPKHLSHTDDLLERLHARAHHVAGELRDQGEIRGKTIRFSHGDTPGRGDGLCGWLNARTRSSMIFGGSSWRYGNPAVWMRISSRASGHSQLATALETARDNISGGSELTSPVTSTITAETLHTEAGERGVWTCQHIGEARGQHSRDG